MINYDLAKKLKDAGFPQVDLGGFNFQEDLNYPTLEELIDACGDGFALFGPNKRFNPLRQIEGTALYSHTEQKTLDDWTAISRELELVSHGSTHEEAVANLWLALNTKST